MQLQKNGRGYSSIHTIRGVLRPTFQLAVDNDFIRKNPFGFGLSTVIYNDSVTREATSRDDERKFLKFVKEDRHFCRYYDGIYILFNTGLRISGFDDALDEMTRISKEKNTAKSKKDTDVLTDFSEYRDKASNE